MKGLEPPHQGYWFLRPARLPFRHIRILITNSKNRTVYNNNYQLLLAIVMTNNILKPYKSHTFTTILLYNICIKLSIKFVYPYMVF